MTAAVDARTVVARGARINAVGVAARVLQPVAFALLTRWYGPAEMGVFLLASAAIDTLVALSTSGLQDAVVAHVSPLDPASPRARRLLASAFLLASVAVALGALAAAAAAQVAPGFLPQAGVREALLRMAPALPLLGFTGMVVAATRARFVQTWDVVLQGLLRPALIIACAGLLARPGAGSATLALAFVLAHVALAAAAGLVLLRHAPLGPLVAAARELPVERPLVAFAIPQGINLALYSLTQQASVLALGLAGLPSSDIALYAAGFAVAASLRHVRLVFTSALAPVAAALHVHGRREELQAVISRSVRSALAIGLPAAAAMVALRGPLLRLFHPSYELGAGTMALLVTAPLLNLVAGFSSNVLVMAGHVRWNLFNTAVAVAATFGLTRALAPSLGLGGAAGALAGAGLLVAALQVIEARALVGVTPRPWGGRPAARSRRPPGGPDAAPRCSASAPGAGAARRGCLTRSRRSRFRAIPT